MSAQKAVDRHSDMVQARSSQDHTDDGAPHDSDDEPMVYTTPRDYATWARQERDRLIGEGTDPDSVILMSEVPKHPRRENESHADFAKRYTETISAMVGRGVTILNDMTTADTVASGFTTADGRFFDLGPGSGATKGEFREFSEWFSKTGHTSSEVPTKWLKFEQPADSI